MTSYKAQRKSCTRLNSKVFPGESVVTNIFQLDYALLEQAEPKRLFAHITLWLKVDTSSDISILIDGMLPRTIVYEDTCHSAITANGSTEVHPYFFRLSDEIRIPAGETTFDIRHLMEDFKKQTLDNISHAETTAFSKALRNFSFGLQNS